LTRFEEKIDSLLIELRRLNNRWKIPPYDLEEVADFFATYVSLDLLEFIGFSSFRFLFEPFGLDTSVP